MSEDTFTEVTTENWFTRLGKTAKGVVFGLVLIVVAIGGLFWNEGRAVKRAKDLEAGTGALVAIPRPEVEARNEGQLVHFNGDATTPQTLSDDQFDVTADALRLRRSVEMYQWDEDQETDTRTKTGGSKETTTTYSYHQKWSSRVIDSDSFHQSDGHQNPATMPFTSETWESEDVSVGSFDLPDALLTKLNNFQTIGAPAQVNENQVVQGNTVYLCADNSNRPNPAEPQIGDVRVTWSAVPEGSVSVLGVQTGQTLASWTGPSGSSIFEIRPGTHTGQAMFGQLEAQNRQTLWIIRAIGFVAMMIGFGMVFAPLAVLADVLPPVGSLVRVGTGLISFLVSTIVSLGTIGIGWVYYRPMIGLPLLGLALAGVAGLIILAVRKVTDDDDQAVAGTVTAAAEERRDAA